jgi:predicted Fe-S protein YdhL (DUF1289 family)
MVSRRKPCVESPCVNICLLDTETGLCIGCFRTIEEIANWAAMSADERRSIMAQLPARQERGADGKG